jgi:hypothetical protein
MSNGCAPNCCLSNEDRVATAHPKMVSDGALPTTASGAARGSESAMT